MTIKDVFVVSIPVSDSIRAKAFYVDVLGFELMKEDTSVPGFHWIRVSPRQGGLLLSLVTWFEAMPPGSLQGMVLTTDDLQGDYERLVAKGVQFDAPPRVEPWGAETIFHDPDGNQLVLQQVEAG